MAQHVIPSDPDQMMQAIAATEPGDELVFNAGVYPLKEPLVIPNDRKYTIKEQEILVSSDFTGDAMIIIDGDENPCVIMYSLIDPGTSGALAIQFTGQNFAGTITHNVTMPNGRRFWRIREGNDIDVTE